MTVDEIRELINLAAETGIAELEVQRGDNRVRIRRASFSPPQEIVVAPTAYAPPSVPAPALAPAPIAAPAAPPAAGTNASQGKPADPGLTLVKSPIVGTFYESPSPGSAPFVRVG